MESDFHTAWEKYFSSRKPSLTDDQIAAYEKFALSNRQRAQNFIDFMHDSIEFDFKDKRILDIGSAYAGFVIMSAKYGAEAHGIEILDHLHQLAIANAKDEDGDITLKHGDVLASELLVGPFDLIIINDVFEHIFDIDLLFQRINDLSGPETVIFFAIPNGFSYHAINKEGHLFKFGLTLLEPGLWSSYISAPFNIYYRPLEVYRLLFESLGYHLYLKVDETKESTAKERIINEFALIADKVGEKPFPTEAMNEQAERRLTLIQREIKRLSDPFHLHVHFEQYFWEGFAVRAETPVKSNLKLWGR